MSLVLMLLLAGSSANSAIQAIQAIPAIPDRHEVENWLGTYTAGPETIAFAWNQGLVYHHGNIAIPADGQWHLSVPEFYVRHRVSWIAERRVILLEESHDASPAWRHELRLDGDRLTKVALDGGTGGGEVVVRVFMREENEDPGTSNTRKMEKDVERWTI